MTRDKGPPKRYRRSPLNRLGIYSSIGGVVLSHYEVGGRIGEGAMGEVYKGRDVRLDRPVAIKVLPHWARGDPQARERLLKEAQAASALNHPNIVTIYEIDEYRGVDLIVMEYVPGRTLNEVIPARGLPVQKALGLAVQMIDALDAAHAANILHGDLKPGNIMVTDDWRLKLLDFGLARVIKSSGNSQTETGTSVQPGTRVYMAPEQLKGQPTDPRSEIFSVGVILHQMLNGAHPFGPGTREEITDAIQSRPPAALPPKVPPDLADLVYRCLAQDPLQRFESVHKLLLALKQCFQSAERKTAEPILKRSAPRPVSAAEVRQIRAVTKRIGYKNIPQSRQALMELASLVGGDASISARKAAVSDLKNMILTLDDYPGGVPRPVREVRKLALDVLKTAAQQHLSRYFQDRDLEFLDLFEMNFAACQVNGLSFRECFLPGASFRGSNLVGACFVGAWIRNADFADADLTDADLTDADWFNALGLTEAQLRSVRRDTIAECPADLPAMRKVLDARYGFPFDSWSTKVQKELVAAWDEYLRPGGVRDLVASWRQQRQ